jgi:hypothetical protein
MRYLLITLLTKPNGQVDEQVAISKRVRTSDNQLCNFIIDYSDKKVLKSVVGGKKIDTDFERINEYYKQFYPDIISNLEKVNQ